MVKAKQEKFLEAYNPVKDSLWRYCLYMARNREFAKDLLGETITAAWQSYDKLKDDKAFLGYIFTIASRIFYRMKKNYYSGFASVEDAETLFSAAMQPDMQTDINLLRENLDKLPEQQKEAVLLFHIEGLSRKEVARVQDVSEETVKSRLARGRKQLAIYMGVDDEQEA